MCVQGSKSAASEVETVIVQITDCYLVIQKWHDLMFLLQSLKSRQV